MSQVVENEILKNIGFIIVINICSSEYEIMLRIIKTMMVTSFYGCDFYLRLRFFSAEFFI